MAATGGGSGNDVVFSSTTTAVCTVSGSTVTFRAAGTCRIAANQAGDADYDAAPTVTQSIDVKAPAGDLSVTADGVAAAADQRPPLAPGGRDRPRPGWPEPRPRCPASSTNTTSLVVPEFNCWFQQDGICHVTSPPVNPTVTFFVWLPANASGRPR